MVKKSKAKKGAAKEPQPEKESEEVIEEIIEEVPEAKVVEERELPKDTGEETSETIMLGGRLMRKIRVGSGWSYKPL